MIKFLHTADLHLGKVLNGHGLGEDQAAMLDQLALLLEDESYAALVISGDVYDRSIPSPDAVELFSSFLGKVKNRRPSPEIFIIPGNHDSASRIGFGRELFSRLGIHFGVDAEDCDKPVIIEKSGEKCAFFLLPFLNPGVLEVEGDILRSQNALAEEAGRRMEKARRELSGQGVAYTVLAAHLFTTGGTEAGSERVFLGSAEQVNSAFFDGFDYAALGHLHRCQNVGKKIWYSGSPLAYSFAEAGQEKFFLSTELKKDGAVTEKIPVKPLHRVTSLQGSFARFSGDISDDAEASAAKDDYLEIRLTDSVITENAGEILREKYPRLLSLRQDEAFAGLTGAIVDNAPSGDRRDVSADFKKFLSTLYEQPDPEEQELFDTLLAETEEGEALL